MNSLFSKLSPSITNMIRMDHTHVLTAFHQFEADTPAKTRQALANTICLALEIHAQLEEEIFYPAMRELAPEGLLVSKSVPEHDEMRRLIAQLRGMQAGDEAFDSTLMELMRDVMHHVADEETTLLPAAERLLGPQRLGEMGAQMTKRRLELSAPRAGEIAANTMRSIPTSTMLVGAGAFLAGTYVLRRAFERRVGA